MAETLPCPCSRERALRFALACLVLLVACAGPPARTPPEPEGCDWFSEGVIGLRDPDARDVITASVSGPSCDGALLLLSIRTPQGGFVYRFDAPLPVFYSVSGDAAELPEDAELEAKRLVSEMTRPQKPRNVGSLPSWAPGEIDDGLRRHQYLLPRDDAERLRDQPVFYHRAGFEHGYELAFDPRSGQVVRVLETWR